MLDCYSKNLDPYMTLASQLDPGHDKHYYKSIRKDYKTILLGAIYGMGVPVMAERSGLTVEDCQLKYDQMFERMAGIKKFIEENGQYCIEHQGYVSTVLGDVMYMEGQSEDRLGRLGVNQKIQGFAACSLADGFFNVNYQSYKHPDKYPFVRVWNTVHDSSQNYFKCEDLFRVGPYFKLTLTDYLYEKFGVVYAFDTEVGVDYYNMCEYKLKDNKTLELVGSCKALKRVLDKCKVAGLNFEIVSLTNLTDEDNPVECSILNGWYLEEEFKPLIRPYYMDNFMNIDKDWGEARYQLDWTEYKAIIRKLAF